MLYCHLLAQSAAVDFGSMTGSITVDPAQADVVSEGCGMVRPLVCQDFDLFCLGTVEIEVAEVEEILPVQILRPPFWTAAVTRIYVGVGVRIAVASSPILDVSQHPRDGPQDSHDPPSDSGVVNSKPSHEFVMFHRSAA